MSWRLEPQQPLFSFLYLHFIFVQHGVVDAWLSGTHEGISPPFFCAIRSALIPGWIGCSFGFREDIHTWSWLASWHKKRMIGVSWDILPLFWSFIYQLGAYKIHMHSSVRVRFEFGIMGQPTLGITWKGKKLWSASATPWSG